MWSNKKKVGFKGGSVFTIETDDEKKFILVSSFSFQGEIVALDHHIDPVLKYYYFLQVTAIVTDRLLFSDPIPCEVGGVYLLVSS